MESDTIADTIGTTTVCPKCKEVSGILPAGMARHSRAVKHYKVQNSSLVHSGKQRLILCLSLLLQYPVVESISASG